MADNPIPSYNTRPPCVDQGMKWYPRGTEARCRGVGRTEISWYVQPDRIQRWTTAHCRRTPSQSLSVKQLQAWPSPLPLYLNAFTKPVCQTSTSLTVAPPPLFERLHKACLSDKYKPDSRPSPSNWTPSQSLSVKQEQAWQSPLPFYLNAFTRPVWQTSTSLTVAPPLLFEFLHKACLSNKHKPGSRPSPSILTPSQSLSVKQAEAWQSPLPFYLNAFTKPVCQISTAMLDSHSRPSPSIYKQKLSLFLTTTCIRYIPKDLV